MEWNQLFVCFFKETITLECISRNKKIDLQSDFYLEGYSNTKIWLKTKQFFSEDPTMKYSIFVIKTLET